MTHPTTPRRPAAAERPDQRPQRTPAQAAAFRRIVRHLLAPLEERVESGAWE